MSSAEGQRFGRTAAHVASLAAMQEVSIEAYVQTTGQAERLTHAEQAKVSLTFGNTNTALVSLDKAAEIERVAREVCAGWAAASVTGDDFSALICRLRALVQPS